MPPSSHASIIPPPSTSLLSASTFLRVPASRCLDDAMAPRTLAKVTNGCRQLHSCECSSSPHQSDSNEGSVLEQVDLIILQCTRGILFCYTVIIKGQKKRGGQINPLPECEKHARRFVIATADCVKIHQPVPAVFI